MFVSSIFKAAGNEYFLSLTSESSTDLGLKILNGSRRLTEQTKSTDIPFPRENMILFFSTYLMPLKFGILYDDFEIPVEIRNNNTLLIQAIVEVFYHYTIENEDSVTITVKDEYERLYNLPGTRKLVDINTTENALVIQVDFTCPITNKKLVKTIGGRQYTDYTIIKIFPDHLGAIEESIFTKFRKKPHDTNDISNLIAVSPSAANEYFLTKNFETFKILTEVKESALKIEQETHEMDSHDIEENISVVIKSLVGINTVGLSTLSFEAMRINEKIPQEEYPTIIYVKNYVLYYYNFLDEYFSLLESTHPGSSLKIAADIKFMSELLQNSGYTASEIIRRLSEAILSKTGLAKWYLIYCEILICYFVQHCEVFSDEITE